MAGGLRRGSSQDDAATMRDGRPTVAIYDGLILAVGPYEEVQRRLTGEGFAGDRLSEERRFTVLDAKGGTVTPGLIDPHTHLLFAGTREAELRLRQRGAGYLEILAAGGGILATVARTRAASDEDLAAHGRRWLDQMLGHGVTTVEAKSGYGLDVPTELRLMEIAARLGGEGPVEVVPTFLGAHAVPAEFRDRPDGAEGYLRSVVRDQLPAVAAQGAARFCDVFCEVGVFSADQSRRLLVEARRLGLEPRLHADELEPSGGAELAAELGAASADHLAAPSREGIAALAGVASSDTPVVATVLPATSLFLMKDHGAPARTYIDRGIPVALGTDFNPGTSPTADLPLVMSLAVLRLGLTPTEALAAVTINAAQALHLAGSHGSLEPGKQADAVVWDVPDHELIPYWLGADLVRSVIKRGQVVLTRS
ncbi:MAG: imidazolonepropionase [Candidatus Limnocylindrales bacterium]